VLEPARDPAYAVVASSNLGTCGAVCGISERVRAEGATAVSVAEAPSASSNIVASSVALRFGLGGPNVMLCNGTTSGADAVRVGLRLLAAGRAERVLVVAAEPDDAVAQRLSRASGAERRIAAGAAALVLCAAPDGRPEPEGVELRAAIDPAGGPRPTLRLSTREGSVINEPDVTGRAGGDLYGALAVVQAALAVTWLRNGAPTGARARVTGGGDQPVAIDVRRAGETP
jgi:hypothetical protein